MFDSFIKPAIEEFKPDLLIVSSGFDSAMGDPLGVTFEITPEGYSYLTKGCLELCSNVIVVLEGGYSLENLKTCSMSVVETLLGEKTPDESKFGPKKEDSNYQEIISKLSALIKPYWKFLQN